MHYMKLYAARVILNFYQYMISGWATKLLIFLLLFFILIQFFSVYSQNFEWFWLLNKKYIRLCSFLLRLLFVMICFFQGTFAVTFSFVIISSKISMTIVDDNSVGYRFSIKIFIETYIKGSSISSCSEIPLNGTLNHVFYVVRAHS